MILCVPKFYEDRIHTFEIRKTKDQLPAILILTDSNYQGLFNKHSATVIFPKKKQKNSFLSTAKVRNTKLATDFLHPKKYAFLLLIRSQYNQNSFLFFRDLPTSKMVYLGRLLPRPQRFLFKRCRYL